jgi:hypothetical protein
MRNACIMLDGKSEENIRIRGSSEDCVKMNLREAG